MRQGGAATAASAWQDHRGLAAFALIVLLLGLNFVMVRYSNAELDPFWGATLRFALAAVVLGAVVAWRRCAIPRGGALAGAVLFGCLGFGAAYGLLYWGMVHVTAGTAGVLFATIPLATLFLAAGVRLERITLRGLCGGVLAVAGIAVIFHERVEGAVPFGALGAVLLAAVAAAAAGVVVKRAPRADPFAVNLVALGVGALLLAVAAAFAHDDVVLPQSRATWFALGWLVLSTVCAFVLMVWLIGRWTASRVSYAGVLAPVVALVGGAVLRGEAVGPLALAGGAIVLLGVYVGALHRPPPAVLPTPAPNAPVADAVAPEPPR